MADYFGRFDGNAALDERYYGDVEGNLAHETRVASPRFGVLTGGASAPTIELSPIAQTLIKCVFAFLAVVFAVSIARIFLISAAFGYANQNKTLNAQLEDARSQGSELEVQYSVYGNADRVMALATEVYGMTLPADYVTVDLFVPTDEGFEDMESAETGIE